MVNLKSKPFLYRYSKKTYASPKKREKKRKKNTEQIIKIYYSKDENSKALSLKEGFCPTR